MLKARWMILAGSLLIVFGLANTLFWGLRQASPFDSDQAGVIVDLAATPSEVSDPTLLPTPSNTPESTPLATDPATTPSPTPRPAGLTPDRLVIPYINLDAPIIPAKVKQIEYQGETYYQWLTPDKFAVGWHNTSAKLGDVGNTVLSGHHNVYGKVFKDLVLLREGDIIHVYAGETIFTYKVAYTLLLPERFKPLTIRQENAKWILTTTDERLTLITCWPADSNTHRVIVVAFPLLDNTEK
jgi:sortase A